MDYLKVILFIIFFTMALSSCNDKELENSTSDTIFVGYKKVTIKSKEITTKFPMAVVYPTNTKSKLVKFGPFEMNLSIGAKIAKNKYPLIIISHGSGGSNLGHRSIAFSLVKKGFIVGMPLHPRNNYENNTDEGTNDNWLNRPKHIKSAIDYLLTDEEFSETIQKEKIAVIGHSAGGYTALTLAGGVGNTQYILNFCKENPDWSRNFCALVKNKTFKPIELKGLSDDRVKALVLMAPVGVLFQGEGALNQVKIPVLLMSAEKDKELVEPYHSELIAKELKSQTKLIFKTIKNAGHFSFITPFPESIKSELGVVAEDPEGFDRVVFHKQLSEDISTFLSNELK